MLDPAKSRFDGGIWVLIGLENVGIRTDRSGDRGGQHGPPMVLFSIRQRLDLDHEAIARLHRWWVHLRRTSPPEAAWAARLCHAVIADPMIPPQAWAAPTVALPLPLILGDRRFGIGEAGEPAGLPMPHVVGNGCRFFLLGSGIGLGLLLGQLT